MGRTTPSLMGKATMPTPRGVAIVLGTVDTQLPILHASPFGRLEGMGLTEGKSQYSATIIEDGFT